MALSEAELRRKLSSDDRVEALTALRDHLAAEIAAGPSPRDLAPLSRQYRDVQKELSDLSGPKEASPASDIAARRASRRAGAKAPRRSGR